jgi:3',5'-cyclic AMP phosphodiesterase CpdA
MGCRTARWLAACLAAHLAAACGAPPPDGAVRASLLFFGDAGAPPEDARHHAQLLRVARAVAAEDRERPADALLVLGDNFYPRGLLAAELLPRVRETLARPWCRFLAPGGSRAAELAGACDLPERERRPIPIHALLGNHDVRSPGSPELQRDAIPAFAPNWRLAARPAETRELAPGVSLVLLDSEQVFEGGDAAPIGEALRAAPGPWRVVAAHRPIFGLAATLDEDPARVEAYARRMRAAVAGAGVPVHVFLAGHAHSLQLSLGSAPDPPLHATAGSASDTGVLRSEEPRRVAAALAPGFGRLDVVGDGVETRLVVTLYRLLPAPLDRLSSRRLAVARYAVDLAGNAVAE